MIEQILLSSDSFGGVRERGGFGQPLHALYPQVRAILASQLGPEAAFLLAEPVVDRANNRIDWYTESDPEHKPVALSDLPDEQRQPILAWIADLLGRGRELAERYAAAADARQAQLGVILRAVLDTPPESEIFVIEGRPVITRWGFTPDRPWEKPADPVHRPATPAPRPTTPPRDVAIPEIAMPEIVMPERVTTPPQSAPPAESSTEIGRWTEPAPLPSPPGPEKPAPPEPPPLAAVTMVAAPEPETSPAPESAPIAPPEPETLPAPESASIAPPAPIAAAPPEPVAPLRYVVVGSRYFWGVVVIAVLLLLTAALLGRWRTPVLADGEMAPAAPNVANAAALARVRQTEAELRARLEQLQARLAERRGQCRPAPETDAPAAPPTIREPGSSASRTTVPPVARHDRDGERRDAAPPVADAGGRTQPPVAIPGVGSDSARGPAVPATTAGRDNPPAIPSEGGDGRRPTVEAPTAERAAMPPVAPGQRPGGASEAPVATVSPPSAGNAMPPMSRPAAHPDASAARPVEDRPPLATAAPRPPSAGESPARTLEDVLAGRAPAAAARRQASDGAPPIKAEPTPEERREFASRMSAVGAATGEITATLLWNSHGDLDLIVRCPAGRMLDYQHPAECGGALDVDANSARDRLSARPVENAFWPAGRAAPGAYEIAVRYAPRKDEQNPQETPFQVRLSRGGQESVFKGTIRPNTIVPVTQFAVER